MAINLDGYALVGIVNPNLQCTQINFMSQGNQEVSQKAVILFDQQIKYIEVEAHEAFRRVKVWVLEEQEPISIDFPGEEVELYDLFLKSLYNK